MDSQLTTPIVTDDETESALVYLGPRGSDDSPSQNPPSHYHLTRDTPNEFVERTPGLTTDESQNGYGTDGSAWSDDYSPPLPANGSGQVEIVDVITENVPSPGHLQMSTVDLISSQSQDDSSQSQGGSQKAKRYSLTNSCVMQRLAGNPGMACVHCHSFVLDGSSHIHCVRNGWDVHKCIAAGGFTAQVLRHARVIKSTLPVQSSACNVVGGAPMTNAQIEAKAPKVKWCYDDKCLGPPPRNETLTCYYNLYFSRKSLKLGRIVKGKFPGDFGCCHLMPDGKRCTGHIIEAGHIWAASQTKKIGIHVYHGPDDEWNRILECRDCNSKVRVLSCTEPQICPRAFDRPGIFNAFALTDLTQNRQNLGASNLTDRAFDNLGI